MDKPIRFFDSNVCVGKRGLKHRREMWKTEDVLKVMDQCGVELLSCTQGGQRIIHLNMGINVW
ncbi:MAG: hypothetical protein GX783_12795 [Clostridiales bacterium]|nr:hypothetical protein [Clostridiales bacterium]